MKRLSVVVGVLACLAVFGVVGFLELKMMSLQDDNKRQDAELVTLRSVTTTTTATPVTTTTTAPADTSGFATDSELAALKAQVEGLREGSRAAHAAQQTQINCIIRGLEPYSGSGSVAC